MQNKAATEDAATEDAATEDAVTEDAVSADAIAAVVVEEEDVEEVVDGFTQDVNTRAPIRVERTDGASHDTKDALFDHLTGYFKWSKDQAREELREGLESAVAMHLSWSDLVSPKLEGEGLTCYIYSARYKEGDMGIPYVRPKVIVKLAKGPSECFLGLTAEVQLETELNVLAQIHDPHVVRLIGAGFNDVGRRFMVLEYFRGGTLADLLVTKSKMISFFQKQKRKLAGHPSSVVPNMLHLAKALEYLHDRAVPGATILHRDIRPDNIGLTDKGHVKLFDFGVAVVQEKSNQQQKSQAKEGAVASLDYAATGLRYLAPEVAMGEPYTEKSEVYSLALTMWEQAAMKLPFEGLSQRQHYEKVIEGGGRPDVKLMFPGRHDHKRLCKKLGELLHRCWHQDPNERPCARDLVVELRGLRDELKVEQKWSPLGGEPWHG
ncbi:unnamed protein product [Chrysoparadoxa australica]